MFRARVAGAIIAATVLLGCRHGETTAAAPRPPSSPPDSEAPKAWGLIDGAVDTMRAASAVAAGGSFELVLNATDDRRIAWIGYYVTSVLGGEWTSGSDSIAVSDSMTAASATVRLSPPAQSSGWIQIDAFAVDGAGNRTRMRFTRYPVSVYRVVAPPMPAVALGELEDWIYDVRRGRLYATLTDTVPILVLSPATMALDTSLVPPGHARGLDLTVGGDSLLTTLDTTPALAVTDLATPGAGWSTIALTADTGAQTPLFLRVAASGRVLLTLATRDLQVRRMYSVNLASDSQTIRTDRNAYPGFLTVSDDRSLILVAGMGPTEVYDAATNTFGASTGPDFQQFSTVAPDSLGRHVMLEVSNAWYPELYDRSLSGGVPYGTGGSAPFALAPGGDTAFFTSAGLIMVTRLSDGVTQQAVALPQGRSVERMLYLPGPHRRLMMFGGERVFSFALDSLPAPTSVTRTPLGRSALSLVGAPVAVPGPR